MASSPKTVKMWFNEEITPDQSSARIVDSDGAVVTGTRPVSSGDPRLLQLALPPLPTDSYGVLWTVTAEDDGHTTTGTVVFGVGVSVAAPTASDATPSTSPGDVVRHWLRIGALAGMVGATGILLIFLWIGADPKVELTVTAVERRMLLLAAWSAVVGLGVAAVDGIVQVAHATAVSDRDWLAVFGGTTWGHLWLLRVAALGVLLVVTLVLHRSLRIRPGLALISALALALVVIEALGSHAASIRSARPAAMLAEALHILAGCIWVGVVLALTVMLWRPTVQGLERRVLLRMIGGPLAVVLLASVGIVLVTGLYSAGRQVETVSGLVTTGYGRALLIKTGLLVVLLVLGALNAIKLHGLQMPWRRPAIPRPARVVSARLIAVEAAVGVGLLIVAGVLAESAPVAGDSHPRRLLGDGSRGVDGRTNGGRLGGRPGRHDLGDAESCRLERLHRDGGQFAPPGAPTHRLRHPRGGRRCVDGQPAVAADRCRTLFRRRAVGFGSGPRDARRHRAQR